MIYLDANFFIIALLDQSDKGKKARALQNEIQKGKQSITSSLVLDEVMWALLKNNRKHLIREAIQDIYAIPNLEVKGVDSLIPLRALHFIENFNLKPRDAFHLAIMESFNVKEIVSDDKDFDDVKGVKRIKIE